VYNISNKNDVLIGNKSDVEEYLLGFIGEGDSGDSPLSTVLFMDKFNDTIIDETSKWVKTEPDAEVVISQNEELKISADKTNTTVTRSTNLRTKDSFVIGSGTVILTFNLQITTSDLSTMQNFAVNLNKLTDPTDNNDSIGYFNKGSNNIGLLIKEGASVIQNVSAALTYKTTSATIKMITTASDIEYYTWNGSAWVQMGATYAHSGSGSYYIHIAVNNNTTVAVASDLFVDNLYLTSADFTTQYPT